MTDFYDVERDGSNRPVVGSPWDDFTKNFGQFKAYTSADGAVSVIASYDSGGYLQTLTRSDAITSDNEQYAFSYAAVTNDLVTSSSGTPADMIGSITFQQKASGASVYTPVRRATYTYYTGRLSDGGGGYINDENGRLGDLKLAEVQYPVFGEGGSVSWSTFNTKYYRYYKFTGEVYSFEFDTTNSRGPTNDRDTTGGPDSLQPANTDATNVYLDKSPDALVMSGLKMVVQGAAFARMAAATSSYQTAADSTLLPYVNHFYNYERWSDHNGADGHPDFGAPEYNRISTGANVSLDWRTGYRLGTHYRVIEEVAGGAGCSCDGGPGTFKYEYAADYNDTGIGYNSIEYNVWRMKTTEYLPDMTESVWADNDRNIVYTNEVGQVMLNDAVHVSSSTSNISTMTAGTPTSGATPITIVTSGAHGLSTGNVVAVSGVLPQLYNGLFTITVVNSTTFTFTVNANYSGVAMMLPSPNLTASGLTPAIAKVLSQTLTFYKYDSQGRLIEVAMPSAVTGYDDSTLDLLNSANGNYQYLSDTSGEIQGMDYYATNDSGLSDTVDGAAGGYLRDRTLQRGELGDAITASSITRSGATATATTSAAHGYGIGDVVLIAGATDTLYDGRFLIASVPTTTTFTYTMAGTPAASASGTLKANRPILLSKQTYFKHSNGASTPTLVYPVAKVTQYRNTDGTGGETTSRAYTWTSSSLHMISETLTQPVVTTTENGPGGSSGDVTQMINDLQGRPVWSVDGDGYITYTQYDHLTGAVVKQIADVDPTAVSSPPVTGPTRSGSLPTALNITTTIEVDSLGRQTKVTDPDSNITYSVYSDAAHETRVYPGWNATTHTTTGPIQVSREYWPAAAAPSGQRSSYRETLTSSATPTYNSTTNAPTGSETLSASNIQSLTRSIGNESGQTIEIDQYFSLAGVTYSQATAQLGTSSNDSASGNYHPTTYIYDTRGRRAAATAPTGTITYTVYDFLGRTTSQWVGTNATPATGDDWAPNNQAATANMVDVVDYVYDNGGVGDSNLTQVTTHPGLGQADRVSQMFYDWRDRLVAEKDGVSTTETDGVHRPISYYVYDNLNEVTEQYRYDGDGVTISSTSGVPNAPSSSLLRAKSTTAYDEQGRAYQQKTYGVDPADGTVSSTALTSNTFYDHRGNVIESISPTGLAAKYHYDGAGRTDKVYQTDGAVLNSSSTAGTWAAAGGVTNDVVLSQSTYTYDAAGNVILTATADRFHDDTLSGSSGIGTLGNSSTAPYARVSYDALYYDAANRLTDEVNAGTNGGFTYTRPTQPQGRATVTGTATSGSTTTLVDTSLTGVDHAYLGYALKITSGTGSGQTATVTDYTASSHTLTLTTLTTAAASGSVYSLTPNALVSSNSYADDNIQSVQITGSPTGGTFTLTYNGHTTSSIAYNASASTVQTALTGLTGVGSGNVAVTGSAGGPYAVRFIGALAGIAHWQITAASSLTGGTSPAITVTVGDAGRVQQTIDPRGIVSRTDYNLLGRTLRTTAAFTDGTPSDADDQTTAYTYDGSGHVLTMTAVMPSGTPSQTTKYIYGEPTKTLASLTHSGTTATATISAGHTYRVGESVTVTGSTPSDYNGTFVVTAVTSTTFTFTLGSTPGSNASNATGATMSARRTNGLFSNDLVTMTEYPDKTAGTASTANGDYTSTRYDALGEPIATDDRNGNVHTYTYDVLGRLASFGSGTIEGLAIASDGVGGSLSLVVAGSGADTGQQYTLWVIPISYFSAPSYSTATRVDVTDFSGTMAGLAMLSDGRFVMEAVDFTGGGVAVSYFTGVATTSRVFAEQDANGNTTSLTNTSGTVVQRYQYNPYGSQTILQANWSAATTDAYQLLYGFQGGRLDKATGFINFRHRDLDTALGRWVEPDPKGYPDGPNDYLFVRADPITGRDSMGLQMDPPPSDPFPSAPMPGENPQSMRTQINNLLLTTISSAEFDCPTCQRELDDIARAIGSVVDSHRNTFGGTLGNWMRENTCGDWQEMIMNALTPVFRKYGRNGCFSGRTVDAWDRNHNKRDFWADTHNWIEIETGGGTIVIDPWDSGGDSNDSNNATTYSNPARYNTSRSLIPGSPRHPNNPCVNCPTTAPTTRSGGD